MVSEDSIIKQHIDKIISVAKSRNITLDENHAFDYFLVSLFKSFDLKITDENFYDTNFTDIEFCELRLKKWCKAISLLPSNLHYATSLQALKSLSITCKRWSIVSCVHDSFLGHSSKRRERLSMKCVATNHSSF